MAPEPRSIPPWVIRQPPQSILPQHNSQPIEPRRQQVPDPHEGDKGAPLDENQKTRLPQLFKRKAGRRWDHLRSAEPVIVSRHRMAAESQSPWREFIDSARYPHIPNEESEVVDEEVMSKLQPTFGYPVHIPRSSQTMDVRKPTKVTPLWKRIWLLPLRHPLGPLACRLTVLSTSIIALALAARIFHEENLYGSLTPERTQIIVAIVVDVVAIPYIGYITVDDYTGKPLGLRPPKARIRLILMDLFFIIFKSASTALGFEAMLFFNTSNTLAYLRALGAFELIGLISWAMTLTINVFREIERLGG